MINIVIPTTAKCIVWYDCYYNKKAVIWSHSADILSARQYLNQPKDDAIMLSRPPRWDLADVDHKTQNTVFQIPCFVSSGPCYHKMWKENFAVRRMSSVWPSLLLRFCNCPASRTTLVATRFRVAVICPIIQVPHCIRVFFYFVWFVFINHIFQFYYELCTYCNILDIYLS